MNNNYYQIIFDLYTSKEYKNILRKKYNKSLSSMYEIIKRHLLANGFEWVEGSSYHTIKPMPYNKLNNILNKLYRNNLWLSFFTRDVKRTIIKNVEYDYNKTIKYYQDELKRNDKEL